MKIRSLHCLWIGVVLGLLGIPIAASFEITLEKEGLRSLGKGGAQVAMFSEVESIFGNWSFLDPSPDMAIQFSHGRAIDTPYYTVAAHHIAGLRDVQASVFYAAENGINESRLNTLAQPENTGNSLSYHLLALRAATAFDWYGWPLGLRLGHTVQSLDGETGHLTHLDVATHGTLFFRGLHWGLSVQNLLTLGGVQWSTGHEDDVPAILTAGVGYETEDRRFSWNIDIDHEEHQDTRLYMGAEYWVMGGPQYRNGFAFRSGLQDSHFTLGLGFLFDQLTLDYTYIHANDIDGFSVLDAQHRFAFGWRFGDLPEAPPRDIVTWVPDFDAQKTQDDLQTSIARQTQDPYDHQILIWGQLRLDETENIVFRFQSGHDTSASQSLSANEDYTLPLSWTVRYDEFPDWDIEITINDAGNAVVIWSPLTPGISLFLEGQRFSSSDQDLVLPISTHRLRQEGPIDVLILIDSPLLTR